MKRISLRVLGWAVALLAVGAVQAADSVIKADSLSGVASNKLVIDLPVTGFTPAIDLPRVVKPAGTSLPGDSKQMVDSLQKQSQTYLAEQRELRKKIKGASADERKRLLEQLKLSERNFLDQTRDFRADVQGRIKELKNTIKENAPQAAGAGESGGRPRHGKD